MSAAVVPGRPLRRFWPADSPLGSLVAAGRTSRHAV